MTKTKFQLERKLNLMNAVTLVVGTIIGSGIFISPKGVLEHSRGSIGLSLIIWVLCGLISLLGSLCYAELGTTLPLSGGDYSYIKVAFGPFAAFLQLWINLIIIRPTAQAIVALTFANYALEPLYGSCDIPYLSKLLLAALCILILSYINAKSVEAATKIQDIFTFAKILGLILIILTGIIILTLGKSENIENIFEPPNYLTIGGISLSLYSGLFAYGGWNFLNFVTEEIINPEKNLPRALYISMFITTTVYVLTNLAFFVALTPSQILKSEAVAVTFGNKYFGFMSWIIPVFVSFSCFGGVNGLLFTSGRLNFVGARDKQLPEVLALINVEHRTPITSIIITCSLSLVMLLSNNVYLLINYVSFVHWLSVASSIAALLYLRRVNPDISRPLKFHWIVPSSFLLVCIFLFLIPLIYETRNVIIGLVLLLSGIPVYFFGIYSKGQQKSIQKIHKHILILTQKLFNCLPQEGDAVF